MNDPSVWFKMAAHLATTVSDTLAKVLPLFQTNSVSEAVKHEAQGLLPFLTCRPESPFLAPN